MNGSTTKKLDEILSNIDNESEMKKFMDNPKVTENFNSFLEYFHSLSKVTKIPDPEMIKRSGIEKSYYYQIMKGTKTPGRDKILRLCIAAGLTLRETTRALQISKEAILYSKNRRDIIISVAINQKASVIDTNILLDKYGELPLQ